MHHFCCDSSVLQLVEILPEQPLSVIASRSTVVYQGYFPSQFTKSGCSFYERKSFPKHILQIVTIAEACEGAHSIPAATNVVVLYLES